MKRLVENIHNIVGVKENTPFIPTFYEQVKTVGDKVPIIQGRGEFWFVSTVILGAKGFVSGNANFMPEISLQIAGAGKVKDFKELRRLVPLRIL